MLLEHRSCVLSSDPSDLVHEVGFHYYRFVTVPADGGDVLYDDQADLLGLVTVFTSRAVAAMRPYLGASPSVSCGEVGFPAYDLTGYGSAFGGANATFQAAMLVRLLLTLRAAGVDRVAWHTHVSTPVDVRDVERPGSAGEGADASLFATLGLRNDVYADRDGATATTYAADTCAYARPSWFALRRLNEGVLGHGSGVVARRAELGTMVLEVRPPTGWTEGGVAWPRLFVLWLDREAVGAPTDPSRVFRFRDDAGRGFQFYSLVPQVTLTGSGRVVGGYRADASADWAWPGWNTATVTGDDTAFEVEVLAAHPTANPSPVCLLTFADLES